MPRKTFYVVAASIASLLVAAIGLSFTERDARAQALPGGGSSGTLSNVRATRHNLGLNPPTRTTTSGATTTEPVVTGTVNEVCVFCHTPHGSDGAPGRPLWNRSISSQTYTGYSSSSLNATDLDVSTGALGEPSKLCLSCHDGSIALGAVSNAAGSGRGSGMSLSNTGPSGTMPYGRNQANAEHGSTRRLGTDLRNDHPISFTYNSTLATADGELRNPTGSASPTLIANRAAGVKPNFPLTGGKVQCSTCHDPHRNTQKFLRKNRLAQGTSAQSSWTDWTFDDTNDQICVGCHTRLGKAWQESAHAKSTVANEVYKAGDAAARDFPAGTTVWQAGCLNCHDTHTVSGSRRLLREGVNTGFSALTSAGIGYDASIRSGTAVAAGTNLNTTSATENTCFQCHSDGLNGRPSPVLTLPTLSATDGVPNIAQEFSRTYRMPLVNKDQGLYNDTDGNPNEVHDITDKDGLESQINLGFGAPANRHVECTDCHNPHRVVKADTFLGAQLVGGDTTRRTHVPSRGATGSEGNIASGALRGAWGVEPSYTGVTSSTTWLSGEENPTFTVKKGDPGSATALPASKAQTEVATYLTREYQLCFKCHSSYANGPLATDFPQLKTTADRGGTQAANANSLTRYTNVAAEFAVLAGAPAVDGSHQGENGGDATLTPVGASWDTTTNAATINHRSWHPVVFPTGRNRAERRMGATGAINMRPPWAANLGTQTMHCSDCHGHSASYAQDTGPVLTQVQGPHGSDKPFLLKGDWDLNVRLPSPAATSLCGKCHNPGANGSASGFGGDHVPDDKMGGEACMYCHVAIPHGWKNKNFLVNLRCVGQEVAGTTGNCQNRGSGTYGSTTIAPYYNAARLRISTWVASGGWNSSACGGGTMEDNCPRTGG